MLTVVESRAYLLSTRLPTLTENEPFGRFPNKIGDEQHKGHELFEVNDAKKVMIDDTIASLKK
jgi:hypothetical protein